MAFTHLNAGNFSKNNGYAELVLDDEELVDDDKTLQECGITEGSEIEI